MKLKWGILGTGGICKTFAEGINHSENGEVIAVASREKEKAEKFGDEFNIPLRFADYEKLINNNKVDIVYIGIPHSLHAEWAIKSARAKKHILCEKPLTLNQYEAMRVIEEAKGNNVFLMEAFMYRCHPQTEKLIEILKEKIIGDVFIIDAAFSFRTNVDITHRLLNHYLAGGGILDVGCYCVSMSRLIAGVAGGKQIEEPIEIKGTGVIGKESRVDEEACALLKFPSGIMAKLSIGLKVRQDSVLKIYGTEGWILVPEPWIPARNGEKTKILINKYDKNMTEEITVETKKPLYTIEADTVAKYINMGKKEAIFPAMTLEDTLRNMKVLDTWKKEIGLVYDMEKEENQIYTIYKIPLKIKKETKMKYGNIKGFDKPISKLVMGTMIPLHVVFDHFFENGGNCFDTAYNYDMDSEKKLGLWIKNRGIRKDVVILDKGAHTPFCNPEDLTKQLYESLNKMQTDYIDIYMLHRDNPEIPVGEFIDVLNKHKNKGIIKTFGVSNWTIKRIEEANAYAKSKNLSGFSCISNNFSLAKIVQSIWPGIVSSSDKDSKIWLKKTQIPLFAWSSQARGFFVRGKPDYLSDETFVKMWYSPDNFEKQKRAKELAEKKNVSITTIVLSYVLSQAFPIFALIGPSAIDETKESLKAFEIQLTEEEVKYLDLE
jgi:predicted dehydrogenase/aryl-alcohol dehydrogenase-like predicted oxidoreductase